jgi:anti-sigma B factor antagonist
MASNLLSPEERSGVTVVRVNEKKLYQQAAQAFRTEMLGLLETPRLKLLLDLSQAAVMNSSALGVVILAYDRVNRDGGRFAVCGLSPILRELFERMHLNELFTVVGTAEEGIRLLSGDKKIPAR